MIPALRSEWIKIRTARANLVLATIAVVLPIVLGTLIAVFGDFEFSAEGETYVNTVLGPAYLCVFLCGVLGVLGIGQEYRHSTIRTTFAAMPRRAVVIRAKIVLTICMAVGLGVLTIAGCFAGARIAFGARDIPISMTEPGENLTATVGFLVLCALFALAGFGVGAIVRQPAGAIPVLLLWPLIVENIVGALLVNLVSESALKYLPFQAGLSLSSTGDDGFEMFGRVASGLYFGGFAALLVGLGWLLIARRDA